MALKKINIFQIKIRWLISCLIFLLCSCNNNEAVKIANPSKQDSIQFEKNIELTKIEIAALKKLVESGDVITRTGNDFTSQSLKSLNKRDQTFSHAGIASIENDSVVVYHAIGGEYNPKQTIKRESFEIFATPYENNGIGIFRFDINKLLKSKLTIQAKEWYFAKVLFDLAFDLKSDDKMYCSEFVYKCFLKATDSSIQFHHSFIKDFEFVGVDDIILDKHATEISTLKYKLY